MRIENSVCMCVCVCVKEREKERACFQEVHEDNVRDERAKWELKK